MWQWFITNGIWILLAVVGGLVSFCFLRHWAFRMVAKVVPKQWQAQTKGIQRIVTWLIIGIGGAILALAVAAVIVSRYGVDVTPMLAVVGGWLLEHGIRILIIVLLAVVNVWFWHNSDLIESNENLPPEQKIFTIINKNTHEIYEANLKTIYTYFTEKPYKFFQQQNTKKE